MSSALAESGNLPAVVERLSHLTQEELAVVEQVLMQLEINRTVAELDELSDGLRASGMMEKLPDIIRQVRENRSPGAA
ncbi:MAG: hypothetical protein ACO1TE_27300 [Prosthecobacter sp.]